MLPAVAAMPLGSPVLPEVNLIVVGSSGPYGACGSSAAGSASLIRFSTSVIGRMPRPWAGRSVNSTDRA